MRPTRRVARSTDRTLGGTTLSIDGYYTYQVQDSSASYVPIPAGKVVAECHGYSTSQVLVPDVFEDVYATVNSNGHFVLECPTTGVYAWDHVEGQMYQWGTYVDVGADDGETADLTFYAYDEESLDLHAVSNYRARTFSVLEHRVPQANSKFGISRSKILVRVSDTDTTFGIFYSPANDRIDLNFTRIFGTDGYLTILHEYGHAFQYGAIEEPRTYACDDQSPDPGTQHYVNQVNQESCAYVEGFAEFFAGWVGEDWLSGTSDLTDDKLETAPYRLVSSSNGYRVEGAVASFLYDLVDDASSPNGGSGDDDSAQYDGDNVVTIMATCSVKFSFWLNAIAASSEFIICAEDSLDALSLQNPDNSNNPFFGGPSWVEWDVDAHGMSDSVVRAIWLYTLYGQT